MHTCTYICPWTHTCISCGVFSVGVYVTVGLFMLLSVYLKSYIVGVCFISMECFTLFGVSVSLCRCVFISIGCLTLSGCVLFYRCVSQCRVFFFLSYWDFSHCQVCFISLGVSHCRVCFISLGVLHCRSGCVFFLLG